MLWLSKASSNLGTRAPRAVASAVVWLVFGTGLAADSPPVSKATPSVDGPREPQVALPPPGYMEASLELIKQERYAEARQRLEPVVAGHPGWGRARFYLALTYHKEQRYEEAEGWFRQALELDPEYDPPRVFFGWCLYYLGKLDEARKMFEAYAAAAPEYADVHFALALIDFDEDDLESAQSRLERSILLAQKQQLSSTESKARARLADVFVRKGDLAQARAELDRSIALNPDNYEPYFKLSRVLQRLGDAEGAEEARNKHAEVLRRVRPEPARDEPGVSR